MDLFINSDNGASDLKHGLTLIESRKNYRKYGPVLLRLKAYCRKPKESEYPNK